jgi:predicted RNA-binding protein with PIN domain
MSDRWVLVDGYSVIHAWLKLRRAAGRSLEQQRDALVRVLQQFGDARHCRVTVVFDGYAAKRKPETLEPTPGVEVLFSEAGKTADDVIERLVGMASDRGRILVVTSDKMERHTVESLGAYSIDAELFEVEVQAALGELEALLRQHGRRRRLGTVRHHFDGAKPGC